MDTRTITKALATAQDLLFGQGQVEQIRGGTPVTVDKINASHVPFSGDATTGNLVSVTTEMLSRFKVVPAITDLLGINPLSVSRSIMTKSYHAGTPHLGSTLYVWEAGRLKSSHDGGMYIDPTAPFPTDWSTAAARSAWYAYSAAGLGCWVAKSVLDFGSYGAQLGTNDAEAIAAASLALNTPSSAAYTASGTTADRPTTVFAGFSYFDTTIGLPIWYTGAQWVTATGNNV